MIWSRVPLPQKTGGLRASSSWSPGSVPAAENPESATTDVNRSGASRRACSETVAPCEKPSRLTLVNSSPSSQARSAAAASVTSAGSGSAMPVSAKENQAHPPLYEMGARSEAMTGVSGNLGANWKRSPSWEA
jgi:hypothetical protein